MDLFSYQPTSFSSSCFCLMVGNLIKSLTPRIFFLFHSLLRLWNCCLGHWYASWHWGIQCVSLLRCTVIYMVLDQHLCLLLITEITGVQSTTVNNLSIQLHGTRNVTGREQTKKWKRPVPYFVVIPFSIFPHFFLFFLPHSSIFPSLSFL